MKAVVLLLCFVALASAQVVHQRPTLRQNSDHIGYPLPPRALRALPINFPNVGDLVATIVQQIVDYIFPDGTSLRSAEPTVEGIGKLVSWIVNQVIALITSDASMLRMQNEDDEDNEDKQYLPMYPFLRPMPRSK
ncbi:uncharacterized protein LOC128716189 [Anopheles marshallii]|uniref:uncharacterized protein LOC128716189 n=1 Tax=Anopheles marshallii TaxID=1521116 RepID=UPI00237B215B|nr:uncharacterized protein LOC128716189 [Anopheles marshallii]